MTACSQVYLTQSLPLGIVAGVHRVASAAALLGSAQRTPCVPGAKSALRGTSRGTIRPQHPLREGKIWQLQKPLDHIYAGGDGTHLDLLKHFMLLLCAWFR